jgi:hypothetical protein
LQALAALAAIALVGYGFGTAGWRGALTRLVAAVGIGSGLAMFIPGPGRGVAVGAPRMRRVQRLGGLVGAAGALVGVLYGGWHSGWLWGLLGYLVGPVFAVLLAVVTRGAPGAAEAPLQIAERVQEAAERILRRGLRNPNAYTHDPRYVLWFACSHLATLSAGEGGFEQAATVVGENTGTVREILTFAGFSLDRFASGEPRTRLLYAMEATMQLFPDIAEKYGSQ